jgi:hypothetical protein
MPRVFLSHRSIPQRGKPSRRKGGDGSWPLTGASNLSLSSGALLGNTAPTFCFPSVSGLRAFPVIPVASLGSSMVGYAQ